MTDILLMVSLESVHPKGGHRIKNGLNKLKNDLKNNEYPPQVKKELMDNIRDMEKTYNDYLNAEDAQKK